MHSCQSIRKLLALIVLVLSLTLTSNSVYASFALPDVAATDADGVAKVKEGMALFKANCASCHAIDKKVIGPALSGVWDRWESEAKLESWVHNPSKFLESGDPYAQVLKSNDITSVMTAFPQLTPEQINSILMYIKNPNAGAPAEAAPAATATADAGGKGNTNWYIWALIGFLVVLAGLLWNITSKIDKTIKEKNGEKVDDTPLGKKIFSKKTLYVLLLIGAILLVVNIFHGAMDLGRSQGYAPDQPIRFSHALHVGQNQIECQYCHIGVEKSRHASIPGTQICMNCHKYVQEGPKYGKEEIAKIYDYAGWDPDKTKFVRAPKNIEWVKIHNLPDHVYFNHSQHVKVGGIKCQTCHGKVEEYEVMKQFAPLSMGWCINCHRQTEVKFTENKYYSVFQKYQEELKKGTKAKVTVADIGGTECQKCHY
ncbi:MAG: c-type cytochrome [Bacteroidetes bacterium]|nr:c-type cytochrome [Bacteroidota bacterium]